MRIMMAMSIAKMVVIALAFSSAGALVGGVIGWALGMYTPDVYRAWFSTESNGRPLDPAQIGTGLGIAQGLILGFVLGCVVLLATAIRARSGSARVNDHAV